MSLFSKPALGLIALIVFFAGLTIASAEKPTDTEESNEDKLPAGTQRVPVSGNVTLFVDAEARIEIHAGGPGVVEARYELDPKDPKVTSMPPSYRFGLTSDGGGARFKANYPHGKEDPAVQVHVPSDTNIQVLYLKGSLAVDSLTGLLNVRADTADIAANRHVGPIDIRLQRGGVRLTDLRADGKPLDIRVVNGSVEIETGSARPGPASVDVEEGWMAIGFGEGVNVFLRLETRGDPRSVLKGAGSISRTDYIGATAEYTIGSGGATWRLTTGSFLENISVFTPNHQKPDRIDEKRVVQ